MLSSDGDLPAGDYSRDQYPTEWGLEVTLHSSNLDPSMSALGQKRTLAAYSITSSARASKD